MFWATYLPPITTPHARLLTVKTSQYKKKKQVVRWDDVVTDDLQERAAGGKAGDGPPTSPAQLRRRCYMAAAEGLGLGRSAKVIRECLLERGACVSRLAKPVVGVFCVRGGAGEVDTEMGCQ